MVPDSWKVAGEDRQRDQELLEHTHQKEAPEPGDRPGEPPADERARVQRDHIVRGGEGGEGLHVPARRAQACDRPRPRRLGPGEAPQVPRPQPGPLHQPSVPRGSHEACEEGGWRRRVLQLQPGASQELRVQVQQLPRPPDSHARLQKPRDEMKMDSIPCSHSSPQSLDPSFRDLIIG